MSLTKIDQQQHCSSSVRRGSLLVNLSSSTSTKKRSSVTTILTSSCSTLGSSSSSSRKRTVDSWSTSAPTTSSQRSLDWTSGGSSSRNGDSNERQPTVDSDSDGFHHIDRSAQLQKAKDGSILHTILVYPQSAPPKLNEPSYCIASSLEKQQHQKSDLAIETVVDNNNNTNTNNKRTIHEQQTLDKTNQQSIFQVVELSIGEQQEQEAEAEVGNQEEERLSGKNSRDDSPEPIVEVKHTSSSSSVSSSSDHSAQSSANNNDNSTKLIRRRTIRRYHRSTIDDPSNSTINTPRSTVELTVSTLNKSTSPTKDQSTTGDQLRQDRGEFGRSQFRTRQIGGGYYNHQIKQQNHQQQQQQQEQQTKISSSSSSSSSLTSSTSTSKIAKCSITTNRKSTTSHHREQLISESSSLDSKKSSSTNMQKDHLVAATTTTSSSSNSKTPSDNLTDIKPSPRLLDLRLNSNINGRSNIEVQQQEESSSVHHSRQSFSSSSTSTSLRSGSLRKAAMSSSLASEAALVQSRHSKTNQNGAISTSSDLSAALASSRHYKSSLTVSDNCLNEPLSLAKDSTAFLNSESLFSSPDVRSLVKEIGTEFAELENALISTTTSGFGNRGATSSLSSRLFGANRRPLSPLGATSQYLPAITASSDVTSMGDSSTLVTQQPASTTRIFPVERERSRAQLSPTDLPEQQEAPYKRSYYKSNLSSASESSEKSGSRSQSDRIKELMNQAQSHVDRYGISTMAGENQTKTLPSRLYRGSIKSSTSPADAEDKRRQELVKEKAEKDEGVKLHQNHCKAVMTESIERIDQRMSDLCKKFSECRDTKEAIDLLKLMIQMIEKAWSVPVCGDDLGFKLCNSLREAGGLDIILGFIQESDINRNVLEDQKSSPYLLFVDNDESVNKNLSSSNLNCEASNKQSTSSSSSSSLLSAKNKISTNKLRLNLSKLNQNSQSAQSLDPQTPSPAPDCSPTNDNKANTGGKTIAAAVVAAKDSDSEIFTSDLGLDSTSVDSLSFVTPPSIDSAPTKVVSDHIRAQDDQTETNKPESIESKEETEVEKGIESCNDAIQLEPGSVVSLTDDTNDNQVDLGNGEEETNLIKDELVFLSARLLSQCLTSENRNYIVENGLDQVIRLACNLITMKSNQSKRLLGQHSSMSSRKSSNLDSNKNGIMQHQTVTVEGKTTTDNEQINHQNSNIIHKQDETTYETTKSQNKKNQTTVGVKAAAPTGAVTVENSDMHAVIGTEILQHLFKHSEDTCSRMISLGGLEAILYGCRSSNTETLRHCASALANLALYGGPEGQQMMIEQKAHVWLFPLAFNEDDNIQYYACLAIVVLVANQEIEADVLKSSTLDLVEPFVTSHEPQKFAESTTSHIHGQSANWLGKLIPLLESKREEARNLACFHFAMEAYIKKEQGQTQVFKEIGAVEPLRKVGSSPIAIASKFACQALRLIGEKEPHKLSQQVPLWTSEDVSEWVSQIGFEGFKSAFVDSRVDGDLLLQLDEDMLKTDIGIDNGIIRRRFLRELSYLKRIADYSSVDKTGLSSLLSSTGHDFVQYIYPMVQLGVTRDNIHMLDSEQLLRECRVTNTIHRMKLAHAIKELQEKMAVAAASNECCSTDGSEQKTLDVFMSYRRSTGSQLASLLKVFLELRNFSVFIDVERLEAGKFDNNLLDSIKAAKNFILILSPNALDRCIGDHECKDWVHKEIVAALASNCNIIPIIDNFHWPDAEQLPEDMRSISYFNGVRWIHDYQDACVDKVERFIRGEINNGTSIGGPQSCIQSTQSSLQRLACGSTYSSTPSMGVATPSIIPGFPSGSVSAYSTRVPFDADYHPLSFANHQYLQQQHSQTTASGGRRQI